MSGGVPPSSRAKGRKFRAKRDHVSGAVSIYERFTGHDAEEAERIKKPKMPDAAAVIGLCDGLLYTTVRDGVTERYIHKFRAKDKPLFCVSPDGKQLLLIGGNYDFTERGIVDASDYKNRP